MTLHSSQLGRLAKLLAKHFPEYEKRQSLASRAGVAATAQIAGDNLESWRDIVHCANAAGTLEILVEAAAHEASDVGEWEAFRSGPIQSTGPRAFGHLWVVLALLMAGAFAFVWKSEDDEARPEGVEGPSAGLEAPKKDGIEPPGLQTRTGDSEGLAINNGASDDEEFRTLESAALSSGVPAADASVGLAKDLSGRCGGTLGELVGYFYAGDGTEARVGHPFVQPRDVNVRADYPRRENRWSSSAPVRCVLKAGDVLVLTADPLAVDGGKYWVPLHAGDLRLP